MQGGCLVCKFKLLLGMPEFRSVPALAGMHCRSAYLPVEVHHGFILERKYVLSVILSLRGLL